jgi:hypothetical protein
MDGQAAQVRRRFSPPSAKATLRYLATNKMVDHKVILQSSLHTDAKMWRTVYTETLVSYTVDLVRF